MSTYLHRTVGPDERLSGSRSLQRLAPDHEDVTVARINTQLEKTRVRCRMTCPLSGSMELDQSGAGIGSPNDVCEPDT